MDNLEQLKAQIADIINSSLNKELNSRLEMIKESLTNYQIGITNSIELLTAIKGIARKGELELKQIQKQAKINL